MARTTFVVYHVCMTKEKPYAHLYRSNTNRVFGGLLGGLGEYYEIDPVILRLFWLVVTIFSGVIPGVLAYFFALFVVPRHP